MFVKKAVLTFASVALSVTSLSAPLKADFSKETGRVNRALHSSGFAPMVTSTNKAKLAAELKEFNFDYTRTHDLALISSGQRIVDTHFIFPLEHLDAKDPKNYYFAPTDYQLDLIRKNGNIFKF